MKSINISLMKLILCCLILTIVICSCGQTLIEDEYGVESEYDAGHNTQNNIMHGNFLSGGKYGGDYHLSSINIQQNISALDTSYKLLVTTVSDNFLSINKDTSLVLLMDNVTYGFQPEFVSTKFDVHRFITKPISSYSYDYATYPISFETLIILSKSKVVKVKIYGEMFSREYFFDKKNLENIQKFLKEFAAK